MVERYRTDGTRYLLMKLGPFGTDMDVSWEKFDIAFTADLSNGLGNLCSRIAKMCEKLELKNPHTSVDKKPLTYFSFDGRQKETKLHEHMTNYDLDKGLEHIWSYEKVLNAVEKDLGIKDQDFGVDQLDKNLSENKPWKMETDQAKQYLISVAIPVILQIAVKLQPFMPETAKKIIAHFTSEKISALNPLFPRLEK